MFSLKSCGLLNLTFLLSAAVIGSERVQTRALSSTTTFIGVFENGLLKLFKKCISSPT